MAKKNKLVSVKLLGQIDTALAENPTQPEFSFRVKGTVEGQKMLFNGTMKIIAERKVEFTFDELPFSLDNWFNECREALTEAVVKQISEQATNR